MCHNPTTDGDLSWVGHEIVAYVHNTQPVKTQAEHIARLNEIKEDLEEEIASYEDDPLPADDEDFEDMEEHINGRRQELEIIGDLLTTPLRVEELSTMYYVGIGAVPGDDVFDVILSFGCPLSSRDPTKFRKGSVQDELRIAVTKHLSPGGELYLMGDWESYHKTYHGAFAPLVDAVRKETALVRGDYNDAVGGGEAQTYSVLVRKGRKMGRDAGDAAGGGRRKTLKRRKPAKKTRRA